MDVPMDVIREIRAMRELDHPNVLRMRDVYVAEGGGSKQIKMVLDLMPYDLEKMINDKAAVIITPADVKECMHQMLEGVAYIHRKWLLHRDLKPGNILIDRNHCLKLADFGLARSFGDQTRDLSPQAVTQWYRPPEMLFGAKKYGSGIDMWSMGCIFAEMLLRRPFLVTKPHPQGREAEGDMGQIRAIFTGLGTPREEDWSDMMCLPNYVSLVPQAPPCLKTQLLTNDEALVSLLQRMMKYDPSKRISAEAAIEDPYFRSDPQRTPPELLPIPASAFPSITAAVGTKRKATGDP